MTCGGHKCGDHKNFFLRDHIATVSSWRSPFGIAGTGARTGRTRKGKWVRALALLITPADEPID
jgi:hypothetical protein